MELPKIKVADFEGPFDLLLHLIRRIKWIYIILKYIKLLINIYVI